MEVTQGTVIYVVAEGASGIRKRVRAWERERGVRMANVLFLPQPVQIADAEWEVFIEVCVRRKAAMVVIDTQARATVGVEENSAKEMGVMVARLDALRIATGANVMLIHHVGRGSKSVVGAMDTELSIEKDGSRIDVVVTKQKEIEYDDKPIRSFNLDSVDISPEGSVFDDPAMKSAYLFDIDPSSEADRRDIPGPSNALLIIAKMVGARVLQGGECSFRQLEDGIRHHETAPLNSRGLPAISRGLATSAIRGMVESGIISEDRAGLNGSRSTYRLITAVEAVEAQGLLVPRSNTDKPGYRPGPS